MKAKVLLIILSLFLIFGAFRLYYFLTDDFRLGNISHEISDNPDWNFASLDEEEKEQLKNILAQEFFYIGKGAQVYAFASKDERWVIKFFKFKHLKPSVFVSLLPNFSPFSSFKEANIQRKKRKLEGLFSGYRTAYLYDKEHSGLFYVHLNKTDNLKSSITVFDKLGLKHRINLDPTVFIIQKKGQTLRQTFAHFFDRGDIATALQRATQILDMYVDEYKNGVWDRDHGVSHNTGFIDDKPLHLDVGKISHDEKMKNRDVYKEDLIHVGFKISSWVQQNYPQYYDTILKGIEDHLSILLESDVKVKQPV